MLAEKRELFFSFLFKYSNGTVSRTSPRCTWCIHLYIYVYLCVIYIYTIRDYTTLYVRPLLIHILRVARRLVASQVVSTDGQYQCLQRRNRFWSQLSLRRRSDKLGSATHELTRHSHLLLLMSLYTGAAITMGCNNNQLGRLTISGRLTIQTHYRV